MKMPIFNVSIGLIVHSVESLEFLSMISGVHFCKPPSFHIIQSDEDNQLNVGVYRKRYPDQVDINDSLHDFLHSYSDFPKKIAKLQTWGKCAIRISVVSILGQFGFEISPSNIELICQCGMPIEITIFSYGNCLDE